MTDLFVSPSRRYIIVYKNKKSPQKHLFDLRGLSELYVNNVNGALDYFRDKLCIYNKDRIISCIPYELHLEDIRKKEEVSKHVEPLKEDTIMSEWDCVKLVERYGYREKEPETFLFSLPRIMVASLEEELTRQANLRFIAEFPRYKHGGPYHKENHYSVVFKVESSGWEHITTYWDHILHREITIFFTDGEAIFGVGLIAGI